MELVTSQPVEFAQVLARASALAEPGRRCILGIAGAPGAGKSTLGARLVDALGPNRAALVPMDGFHLATDVLESLGRAGRKGAVDTFDDGGYAALIGRLRAQDVTGDVVYAPLFRRDLEEPIGSALPICADVPLIVTEGNYLLQSTGSWPVARSVMDEVWFVATSEEVRHRRLIDRHVRFGKSVRQARAWVLGSDERNAELVAASASRADWVLRLNEAPPPDVQD